MCAHTTTRRLAIAGLMLFTAILTGCEPAGTGTLRVVANGEEGAQEGFSSADLVDGWSVVFERYLVSVGQLRLSDAGGEVASALTSPVVVDLHAGIPELARLTSLPAGRLSLEYAILPPTADSVAVGNVSPADIEAMRAGGLTYLVEGVATKPSRDPVRFRLGIPVPVRMLDCTNGVDGTRGVVIPASSEAEAELTLHTEHLFYDRLGTHADVQLRFEAIAAMADEDGLVTLADLAGQDLLNLVDGAGQPLRDADGSRVVYDPGSTSARTLDQFLERSLRDQAHLNGEGLCTIASP